MKTTAGRPWAAQPQLSDERVREGTGRGWEEWRAIIDAWPGRTEGHTAIAAWLQKEHGLPGWWAQSVTVGYERIAGIRLPHQDADGTFRFGITRTVGQGAAGLRERLLDPAARAALFPGLEVELRSRPSSKNVRLRIAGGSVELAIAPRADGRASVTIQHAKLDSPADVETWRTFWARWLERLGGA